MPATQEIVTAAETEQDGQWVHLCETAALDGLDGLRVIVAEHALAVFKVDDRFYVTDDTCTHGAASLADGLLHGCEIECPFHAGRFDVRTGAATAFPCVDDLATYPARVRDGTVYARMKTP